MGYPRLFIKDTAVAALCYGAALTIPGVVRYSDDISIGDICVAVTIRGEAVALMTAEMTTAMISTAEHGMVGRVHRVLVDRDELYPRRWGLGPHVSAIC